MVPDAVQCGDPRVCQRAQTKLFGLPLARVAVQGKGRGFGFRAALKGERWSPGSQVCLWGDVFSVENFIAGTKRWIP